MVTALELRDGLNRLIEKSALDGREPVVLMSDLAGVGVTASLDDWRVDGFALQLLCSDMQVG